MMMKLALWLGTFAVLLPLLIIENRFWSQLVAVPEDLRKIIICYFFLAILSAVIYFQFNNSQQVPTIVTAIFFAFLASLSIVDAKTQYIPNIYPAGIAMLGLIVNFFTIGSFDHPLESIATAILSYALLYGINSLYKKFKGVDGIGMGDAKLFAALGCWFGWGGILPILIISNALFITMFAARGRWGNTKQAIAFGPYLAIAGGGIFLPERWLL